MFVDTTYRSDEPEIMDNFSMEGEILRDALDKIAAINRLLGGNKVTIAGLKWLLKGNQNKEISVLDVGCGNGDMLRALANYGKSHQLNFKLNGIDANAFTIRHAQELSKQYRNINYTCADIFDAIKQPQSYDVILCTLTLHHFKDEEILELMDGFKNKSNLGIVVNDLHRSALAYYLFEALCFVFRLNKMSRKDGLVSILRGFKKDDLKSYSRQLNLKKYVLRWKWAFRYQWTISTNKTL